MKRAVSKIAESTFRKPKFSLTDMNPHALPQFEIVFLGSGGISTSSMRGSPCTMLNLGGENWLFDSADGSVRQYVRNRRVTDTNKIFISHLHGDCIFGLPMSVIYHSHWHNRAQPLQIYGPPGLYTYLVTSFSLNNISLPREVVVNELLLDESVSKGFKWGWKWERFCHPRIDNRISNLYHNYIKPIDGYWELVNEPLVNVTAGLINHQIPCFGYVVQEGRVAGKLNIEKLANDNIPKSFYRSLKAGIDIELDGRIVYAKEYACASKPGRKFCIVADNNDASNLKPLAYDCDVLVHECSFSDSKVTVATNRCQSTPLLAVKSANQLNAKRLILNHIGPKYIPVDSIEIDDFHDDNVSDRLLLYQVVKHFNRADHVAIARDFMSVKVPVGGYSINNNVFNIHRHTKAQSFTSPPTRPNSLFSLKDIY